MLASVGLPAANVTPHNSVNQLREPKEVLSFSLLPSLQVNLSRAEATEQVR